MKKPNLWLVLGTLMAGLALAQPAPPRQPAPPPPTFQPAPPPPAAGYGYREVERAWKELSRLQYELPYAQGRWADLARQIADSAQRDYQAGRHFQAAERAKAARKILEAGRLESGLFPAFSRGPAKKLYEAPYRASERISRVEMEVNYYRINNPLVSRLLREARGLLGQANPNDPQALYKAEAAHHLASAAHDLIKAERGF
jgi:hypothetical protein